MTPDLISISGAPDLVIGMLLTHPDRRADEAVQNLEKLGLDGQITVDISVRGEDRTAVDFVQYLQAKYQNRHILLLHESVHLPFSFLETIDRQIRYFADKSIPWGLIGNSGVSFPYFRPICNMLLAGGPLERFAGVLPAAHLDPYLMLIHKDVRLATFAASADCPRDAPLNDLLGIAAWEDSLPCWICNLPAYAEGSFASSRTEGDSGAWARYLAERYNNASFVSSYGTIELKDHAADARDYYYSLVEPALNRLIEPYDTASVSIFLFATYYDVDIFDRCLMSVASQFRRPEILYVIGLDTLDQHKRAEFQQTIERYRPYLRIYWNTEDSQERDVHQCLRKCLNRVPDNGYSLIMYDTFVLFPQAVRQICTFLKNSLGDRDALPVTTAEVSRLHRSVETHIPDTPRPFYREVEKFGFTHKDAWLSAQPSATLHFTFPNAFLKTVDLAEVDLTDLGSCLPQRLLAEPFSFFLIERGAGYMSFQKPSPDETHSPLQENGSPRHLANKAHWLFSAKSNIIQYSMNMNRIAPSLSYLEQGDALQREQQLAARVTELEALHHADEQEIARLHQFVEKQVQLIQKQENSLNKFRKTLYFRFRKSVIGLSRKSHPKS